MDSTARTVSEWTYDEPKKNSYNSYNVNVHHAGNRIQFQLANDVGDALKMLWGLSTPLQGQEANSRRSLDLEVHVVGTESLLRSIDENNVRVAVENTVKWFNPKKELSADQIRDNYVPLLKPPYKEGARPTTRIKVKVPRPDDTDTSNCTNVFVVTKQTESTLYVRKGSTDDLAKNAKCIAVVDVQGLWFMRQQFGMNLVASDILVFPGAQPMGVQGFVFGQGINLVQVDDPMACE